MAFASQDLLTRLFGCPREVFKVRGLYRPRNKQVGSSAEEGRLHLDAVLVLLHLRLCGGIASGRILGKQINMEVLVQKFASELRVEWTTIRDESACFSYISDKSLFQ